jgi:hypothetical protein
MMRSLESIPTLIDQNTRIVVIESPNTERFPVLQKLYELAKRRSLPLFFWNPGYALLQQVQFEDGQKPFTATSYSIADQSSVLQFLLNQELRGIFAIEGIVDEQTGSFSQDCVCQLTNAFYDLPHLTNEQYWLLLGEQIQLPPKLVPLIPQVSDVLPNIRTVGEWLKAFFVEYPAFQVNQSSLLTLTKACVGLPLGEIQTQLLRSLPTATTLEQMATYMVNHKISKLRGRGLEFISEPDVPAGGLDLLGQILEQAAALLSPRAPEFGLSFPKGIILWGPPGTGKSLSAKHAAQKMGVPLVAADWGGLLSDTPGESEANLRFLLQIVEATSPCVLYWDDFDKGFAGWNSEAGGGVQRRLAGKLLTWMQERTSPVYVIATVNRLEMLPAELNRRFDDIIFVDLPHAGARKEIFDIHLRKYSPAFRNAEHDNAVFTDAQWHKLLREYNICTAAEIGKSVRKAAEEAFCQGRPGHITVQDLLHQRQLFTPAMVREEDQLLAIRKRATYARPASSQDTSKWRTAPSELFEFLGKN